MLVLTDKLGFDYNKIRKEEKTLYSYLRAFTFVYFSFTQKDFHSPLKRRDPAS
jgi:hypothetical protein